MYSVQGSRKGALQLVLREGQELGTNLVNDNLASPCWASFFTRSLYSHGVGAEGANLHLIKISLRGYTAEE